MSARRLPLDGVDVAILAGGMGARLRGVVAGVPKPLAPVAGRPFLFYLLDHMALRGARSVVLCCGYLADTMRQAVGDSWLGMPVRYSVEESPLGTGGALALARPLLHSDPVVLLNGDTWFEPCWDELLEGARERGACLAAASQADASRYGTVDICGGLVTRFHEKAPGGGLINAGACALAGRILNSLPERPYSIERDLFPSLALGGALAGISFDAPFLDIGTPEDYARARGFLDSIGILPHPMFPDDPDLTRAQVKLGTCVIIRDDSGRILFERRADCARWGLPGGRLDAGETLLEGALREALEETGLRVELTRFIGVFSDPRARTVLYPENGDLRHLVDVVIEARIVGGSLASSPESLDLAWFDPADAPLSTLRPVVEMLRAACAPSSLPALC